MKKIRKILLGAMISMALALVMIITGVKAYAAIPTSSGGAAAPYLEVKMYTYDQDGWDRWQKWSGWNIDYQTYNDAGKWKDMFWEDKDGIPAQNDPSKSAYEYYGNKTPTEILAAGIPDRSEFTTNTFLPGSKIYIEFVTKSDQPVQASVLGLNFPKIVNGSGVKLTTASTNSSDYTIIPGDVFGSKDSSGNYANGGVAQGFAPTINADNPGWKFFGYTGAASNKTYNTNLGEGYIETAVMTLGVTISESAMGSYSLALPENAAIIYETSTQSFTSNKNQDHFVCAPTTITVGNGSDNTDATFTVDGNATTSDASTTIGSNSYDTFSYANITKNATDAVLRPTVAENGVVEQVRYSTTLNSNLLSSAPTVTGNAGDYSIPLNDLTTSNTLYVAVKVKSQSGAQEKVYIGKLNRTEDDVHELTGLSFKNTDNTSLKYYDGNGLAELTTPASEMTIKVKSSTTAIKINPDWNTNYVQTCTVDGTSLTRNTDNSYTIGSSATSFKIVMTSQKGNTTEYTVKIHRMSDDTGISSVMIKGADGTVKTLTAPTSGTTFEFSGDNALPYYKGNQTFQVSITTNSTTSTIKLNSTAYSSGIYGTAQTFTATTSATSKSLPNLVVTSESGQAGTSYTIIVHREGASTNTELSASNSVWVKDQNKTTNDILTADSSGNYAYTASYGSTAFGFNIKLKDSATQKAYYSVIGPDGTEVLVSETQITNFSGLNTVNFAPGTGNATTFVTVKIKVVAEDGNTSKTYDLKVTRSGGSTSSTINGDTSIVVLYGSPETEQTKTANGSNQWNVSVSYITGVNDFKFKVTTLGDANQTLKYEIGGNGTFTPFGVNAPISVNFTSVAQETKVVKIRVYAQDTTQYTDYILNVTRAAAATDATIDTTTGTNGLKVYASNGTTELAGTWSGLGTSSPTYTLNQNLPYKDGSVITSGIKIWASWADTATAKTEFNSTINALTNKTVSSLFEFSGVTACTITIKIIVTAQDGSTSGTYYVVATRAAADNDTTFDVKMADAAGNDLALTSSADGLTYEHSTLLPYTGNTYVTVTFTLPTNSTAVIKQGSTTITGPVQLSFTTTGALQTFTFKITTDADSVGKTITIKAGRAEPDDSKSVELSFVDQNGDTVTATKGSGTNTLSYTLTTLPYSASTSSVTITFTFAAGTPSSTILYDPNNQQITTGQFTYEFANSVGAITETKKFVVCTEKNPSLPNGSLVINVTFKRAAADSNNTLDTSSIKLFDTYGVDTYTPTVNNRYYTYELSTSIAGTKYGLHLKLAANSSLATIYASYSNDSSDYLASPYVDDNNASYNIGSVLYVVVVAQNGDAKIYTFDVKAAAEKEHNNQVRSITIANAETGLTLPSDMFTFTQVESGTKEFNFTVPYSVKGVTITPVLDGQKATWALKTLPASSNTVTLTCDYVNTYSFQAKAEDTTLGPTYVINITRSSAKTGSSLETLLINNVDVFGSTTGFDSYSSTIIWPVARNVGRGEVKFTVSDGASYEVISDEVGSPIVTSGGLYNTGLTVATARKITISVISEKNKVDENLNTKTIYSIYIIPAEQGYQLDDLKLYVDENMNSELVNASGNNFVFNPNATTIQEFIVPYGSKTVYPVGIIASNSTNKNAIITGDHQLNNIPEPDATPNSKTYTIMIESEFNKVINSLGLSSVDQATTYTIKITREEASTENRLATLSIKINGTEYVQNFDPDTTNPIAIEEIPASASGAVVTYTLKDPVKSSIVEGSDVGNISFTLSNTSLTKYIKVKNEKGNIRTYTYILTTGQLNWEDNCTITSIQLYADSSRDDLLNNSFLESNTNPYSATVRNTVNQVTIHVETATPTASVKFTKVADGTAQTLPVDSTASPSSVKELTITLDKTNATNNEYRIVCISQGGTTATVVYTVKVTSMAADNDTTLGTLTIDGVEHNPGDVIHIPHNQDSVTISAEPNSEYAQIGSFDENPTIQPGEKKEISIPVTSEGGTTVYHKVTIERDAEDTLDDLQVFDFDDTDKVTNLLDSFAPNQTVYELNVPYEVDSLNLDATATGGAAVTITGNGKFTLSEGDNTREIVVTVASGATKTYTLKVKRAEGKTGNLITSYIAEDGSTPADFSPSTNTLSYVIDRTSGIDTFNPTIETSEGTKLDSATNLPYSIRETDLTLKAGRNVFHINVTSQTGVVNTYTATIWYGDLSYAITDIRLLVEEGGEILEDLTTHMPYLIYDPSSTNYNITVPFTVTKAYVVVELESTYAEGYINSSKSLGKLVYFSKTGATPNKIEVYAKSEYGKYNAAAADAVSDTYTINVTRNVAESNSKLQTLQVLNGTQDLMTGSNAFNPDKTSYFITNIGEITSVQLTASPQVITSVIRDGDTGTKTLEAYDISDITGYVFNYTIRCTAEDGSYTDYEIRLSRGQLSLEDLQNDNTISYIEVIDSSSKVYLNEVNFNADTVEYTYTIPVGVQSYTINAYKPELSVAKIFGTVTSKPVPTDKQPVTHEIYAESKTGIKGTVYKIILNFETPSNNANLASITINGAPLADFDPDKTDYQLPAVANTVDQLQIGATLADPDNASMSGTGTTILTVGPNAIHIIVTAQDGSHKVYTLNVSRDTPLPYLTDLSVIGEILLDDKDKRTTFAKNVYEYHVIVPYYTTKLTMNCQVDNDKHSVACSNAVATVNSGYTRTFEINNLPEGTKTFTIQVTSIQGGITVYKLVVQRRGASSMNTNVSRIDIAEIPEFAQEYSNTIREYHYQVPNKINNLTITVTPEKGPDLDGDGATYRFINDKGLKVGVNYVVIFIIAEDGVTTKTIVVEVDRMSMNYEVDMEAYEEYECTPTPDNDLIYNIELGGNPASIITDYTKYIKCDKEDNLQITVLTDTNDPNCNEVLVRIFDGSQEAIVSFNITHNNMNFTVEEKLTVKDVEVPATAVEGKTDRYAVEMGNLLPADIDFTNFINTADDPTLTKTVLTDTSNINCGEVVVEISNGYSTKLVKFELHHKKLQFAVKQDATEFECVKNENEDSYTIKLGDKYASAIEDYSQYIQYDSTDPVKVEVLTDTSAENCNEVYVRVSNDFESKIVRFNLETTATGSFTMSKFMQNYFHWILLLIVIILMIIIIIFVNKDKYGAVNKKRKKQS